MTAYMTDPDAIIASARAKAVPVLFLSPDNLAQGLAALSDAQRAYAKAAGFKGQAGKTLVLTSERGAVETVLFGTGKNPDPMMAGRLAGELPEGTYSLEGASDSDLAHLAFVTGAYRFTRYKPSNNHLPRLRPAKSVNVKWLKRMAKAVYLARDLVNTPANDMGPDELEAAARNVAREHKAKISVTKGDKLIDAGFPMIHAVGRASDKAPRLIDMKWGPAKAPKVTLVGKGVCFDTGGLDLKPSSAMLLMKKDMGGAANVLALAGMIMDAGLNLRLRVLIPAVENNVSANAFRPGDVLNSRKGLTVEIGNTDAEGRLVLADAMALADDEKPELMIDMATLTGAARVALGPEVPPFFTDDDLLAASLVSASEAVADPIWRLPLWKPYMAMIDSKIADLNNAGTGGFAGAITAALFLSRFVEKAKSWAHFDIYAWNPSAKPGRPDGGEAMAIRAIYAVLEERYRKR